MTQRIFDVENEKDMQDLWDIIPENIVKIQGKTNCAILLSEEDGCGMNLYPNIININWHDKTEITRPIQEATEADIGRLCYFGDVKQNKKIVGLLGYIDSEAIYNKYMMCGGTWFSHARRLTKQEIEKLIQDGE